MQQKAPADQRQVFVTIATPGYFRAMSSASGRSVSRRVDGEKAPRVAVISEALRRREWPGESPVGRRIRVAGRASPWRRRSSVCHPAISSRWPRQRSARRKFSSRSSSAVRIDDLRRRGHGDPSAMMAAGSRRSGPVDPLQTFYDRRGREHDFEAVGRTAALQYQLVSVFAAGGARALCHRDLRRHQLRDGTTHPGDWCAHGARRRRAHPFARWFCARAR